MIDYVVVETLDGDITNIGVDGEKSVGEITLGVGLDLLRQHDMPIDCFHPQQVTMLDCPLLVCCQCHLLIDQGVRGPDEVGHIDPSHDDFIIVDETVDDEPGISPELSQSDIHPVIVFLKIILPDSQDVDLDSDV